MKQKDIFKIGRSNSCDIIINEPTISSVHAIIRKIDGIWYIYDNNSTNGLFLNDKINRIGEAKLDSKFNFLLGNYMLSAKNIVETLKLNNTNTNNKQEEQKAIDTPKHKIETNGDNYNNEKKLNNPSLISLYFSSWRNYATFNAKAKRLELWLFLIVNFLIKIALMMISIEMGFMVTSHPDETRTLLDAVFALVAFIPTIAVSIRRIHDVGLSGWWGWIFLPLVIPMIIVAFIDSKGKDHKKEALNV